jgi:hypothetical protein
VVGQAVPLAVSQQVSAACYAYLDAAVLRRLWALLWLPAQLRKSWEQKFPALAEITRVTATA